MRVPVDLRAEIIQHCRETLPNQACGLVLFDAQGVARHVERAINVGAWPYGFQIAPSSMFAAFRRALEMGAAVAGVYHCHTVSRAIPTGRDLERPVPPGYLYLVTSLLDPDLPELRGFRLERGVADEVDLDTGRLVQSARSPRAAERVEQ